MDNRELNILNGLKKKLNAINELLRVTKLIDLTGDKNKFEKEAEDYIYMIESREAILNEIMDIDRRLVGAGYKKLQQTESYVFPADIQTVESDIKDCLLKIIALDSYNNKKAKDIRLSLKNAIKGINQKKNINSAYQRNLYSDIGSFDTKR
jgi:hypothetical protein